MSYLKNYLFNNKKITFPVYLTDATLAVTRSLDSIDLINSRTEGVVVNTLHLMSQPGDKLINQLGGIKKFMGFDGLVVSDSGGFQLLSIIYKNPQYGKVTENGVTLYQGAKGKKQSVFFTPERSIQVQFNLRADILICLDDCPRIDADHEDYEQSVQRTVSWAERCKKEFIRLKSNLQSNDLYQPSLFAVVQGGDDPKLREKCARQLIKIGFDGYGFGGWPMDKNGQFNFRILKLTANLIPINLPKFALGVGDPRAIVEGFKMGYNVFDCVLPTRDARHQRLYVFTQNPDSREFLNKKKFFNYLHIYKKEYASDLSPISEFCNCHSCKNYSRAYLYHLFKIKDPSAWRLATIHNLRFYSKLTEVLKKKS